MMLRGLAGLAIVMAAVLCAPPADAQTERKRVVRNMDGTVVRSRDEDGRSRTRIIIQRRSYLDPGTEVLQGERNYTDYVMSPTYSPNSVLNNTAFGSRGTLPGPWDLPGKRNLWGW